MISPKEMNTVTLAYMGDAVYEVFVRKHIMEKGLVKVDLLHKSAITYVRAKSQALALRCLMEGFLSEEEQSVGRRGRNHKVNASKKIKKNANPMEDKWATGFEAVIGYIYLTGNEERLREVIYKTFEIIESEEEKEL